MGVENEAVERERLLVKRERRDDNKKVQRYGTQ